MTTTATDPVVPVPLSEALYCTREQAIAAGALDSDWLDDAIYDASRLCDWYTSMRFMPVTETIDAVVLSDGTVVSHVPVLSVDSVSGVDAASWPGPLLWDGRETVAQCYNGIALLNGWSHWSSTGRATAVRLTGVVGHERTPVAVTRAAARLAAMLSPNPFAPGADAEGNAVARVPGLPPVDDLSDPEPPRRDPAVVDRATRSTGDAVSDGLLARWVEQTRLT